jgi:hypothetical protein
MGKAIDIRVHGISFKEGLRRMLATPPIKSDKPKKTARKSRKRS